jgi:NAD(P)H dehydrogenase (quinone)
VDEADFSVPFDAITKKELIRMKHLIVVAHPLVDSFTMNLMRAYASELEKLGHTQVTADLYRQGFDPVLPAHELGPISLDNPSCTEVAQAQSEIRAADVLTLIYPLWWLSMPAILKGYIDRVFSRGFAYESQQGVVHGLLGGKRSVLITLSGAPLQLLESKGSWNAILTLQDTHVLRSAGFDLLEHLHFDQIAPGLSQATADAAMTRVGRCAREHFSEKLL